VSGKVSMALKRKIEPLQHVRGKIGQLLGEFNWAGASVADFNYMIGRLKNVVPCCCLFYSSIRKQLRHAVA
jgi:hypothetical protein